MKSQKVLFFALSISVLFLGYLFLRINSLESGSGAIAGIPKVPEVINLWVIFLTGLTVGGLTCLAVQGGLLASVIAAREEEEVQKGINKKDTIFPTAAFLLAKLIAYLVLGFFFGAFGGAIGINQTIQIAMQLVAGIYMVLVALNLLNIHPIFRYAIIQPPKFLTRRVRNQSKSKNLFAPALLGAMTIFIPCGTTLAMEALAISSGSAVMGALIMAVFVLGTTPLFFGVGFITSVLGDNFRTRFLKIAALGILYLGGLSIYGAIVASGFQVSLGGTTQNEVSVTQNPEITITSNGYSPRHIKVKKGEPVNIKLTSRDAYSCALAFRIPSLGIVKNLGPNDTQLVTFTPTQEGKIQFNCSMGMYTGVIEVL